MLKLSRFQRMNLRESFKGNTLAEYGLPLALVVVSSGIILTLTNVNGLIPDFLASASGSSVSGNTINGKVVGSDFVSAPLGNGSGGGGVGLQATIIGGGGGGLFITGGSYGGAPETVGGPGTGRTLVADLPAPAIRLPDGNPDMTIDSYPAAVRQSTQTNRQIEATTDPGALRRLVVQKAADSARVHTAAWRDPDGFERYGGEAERSIDDVARGETVEAASEGNNDVAEQTEEECNTTDGNCGGSSESPGGFLSGLIQTLITMIQNPADTASAANPDKAQEFALDKIEELKARVEGMAAAEAAAEEAAAAEDGA